MLVMGSTHDAEDHMPATLYITVAGKGRHQGAAYELARSSRDTDSVESSSLAGVAFQ